MLVSWQEWPSGYWGSPLQIGIRAWSGSVAGPQDGTMLVVRSRDAVRRLAWSPNELGPARAYVSGLSRIWRLVRRGVTCRPRISEVVTLALQLKVVGELVTR